VIRPVSRAPVLAVLGGSRATDEEIRVAEAVGAIAASNDWVVLTGGGPGVMAAASRGAVGAGGRTIGVLPVATPTEHYPNPWVEMAVFTGAGSARNTFNVLSADLCVAIGGGAGTLSEIALSLKLGTEVWCWASWSIEAPPGRSEVEPRRFESRDDLLDALGQRLSRDRSRPLC